VRLGEAEEEDAFAVGGAVVEVAFGVSVWGLLCSGTNGKR
jgi:hypothetical protein